MDPTDYSIKVNPRAKTIRLKVSLYDASVIVTVPPRFDRRGIPGFVAEKRQWIERTQRRVREQRREFDPAPPHVLPGRILLRAVGEEWSAGFGPARRPSSVEWDRKELRLLVSEDLSSDGVWRPLLRVWLSRMARVHLVPWLHTLSEHHELPFARAIVRGQRTRWASCSRKQTISVNHRLLFLPLALVRYVFVHELCHIEQLNHSRKFWALVAAREPNYEALDREVNLAWRYVPAWVDEGS